MTADLSAAQRQFLKALAHPLQPVVQIGAAGVGPGVIDATHAALERHELIKVKLPRGEKDERLQTANALAETTHSHLCQLIGRVAILYRRRAGNLPGKERIRLP